MTEANEGREEKQLRTTARAIQFLNETGYVDQALFNLKDAPISTSELLERFSFQENKELRDQLSKEREISEQIKKSFGQIVHDLKMDLQKEREMRKELVEWMESFKKLEPIITYPDNVPPEHEGEMIALSNALYKMKHLIAKATELDKK